MLYFPFNGLRTSRTQETSSISQFMLAYDYYLKYMPEISLSWKVNSRNT